MFLSLHSLSKENKIIKYNKTKYIHQFGEWREGSWNKFTFDAKVFKEQEAKDAGVETVHPDRKDFEWVSTLRPVTCPASPDPGQTQALVRFVLHCRC